MTNEFVQAMVNACVNSETIRQDDNQSNKSDKLNEIMKDLCDWMADTKFVVREISFYSRGTYVYAHLSVGKSVDGKMIAIDREFYLGGCCSSQSWDGYKNDLELESMLEELKKSKSLN